VRVGLSEESSLQWWCEFNTLVSPREGRRSDKALPEDKAKAASLSGLNGNEA
jgi:hypothetical protein